MTTIAIRDKTLEKHYKGDYQTVWEEVSKALIPSIGGGKVFARWFVERTFDQIRYRVYYGNVYALIGRYKAKIGADWAYINKREDIHEKLFRKLELDQNKIKPIKLTSVEDYDHGTTKDFLNNKSNHRKIDNRTETIGSTTVDALEIPTTPIDMLAGDFGDLPKADFIKVKQTETQGRKERVENDFIRDPHGNLQPKYRFLPNLNVVSGTITDKANEKGKDIQKGKTHRKTVNEEIPNTAAQIAKIIQSFPMVESEFQQIIKSYDTLGFYSTFMPMGEIGFDPDISDYGYLSPEKTARGQAELAQEESKKTKGTGKDDLRPLTQEAYDQLKKVGKPVEKSRVLENLVRRRESVKHVSEKQNQNIATLRRGLNGLIEAYWEPVLWTNLKNFDKVMNSITGFKEFKKELRNRTELIERYRRRGKKMKQVFYCLQGKAGVGKTEIATRLAKAYMRPINTLGMAGQNHPKILKGMRPTLNNAKYGRVAEAFIDCKWPTFKTIKDLNDELKELKKKQTKNKKSITRLEAERIDFLEKEIKEIKDKQKNKKNLEAKINELKKAVEGTKENEKINEKISIWELEEEVKAIDGKYYDLSSAAPVILLDEFEKAKDETVLFIVGQMTDKGINWDYQDEFLECNIDLSQAIILLTSNYWHKVPDFVRSRCKRVNINLLSYKERMEILHTILAGQVRERFYSDSEREDEWRKEMGIFTDKQKEVFAKLEVKINEKGRLYGGDKFLRLCMTEEFGVRGSIQNLEYMLDFLELMDERGWLDQISDMNDYTNIEEQTNPDGSGVVNLTYAFQNVEYMDEKHDYYEELLTFDKKRDVEVIEEEKKKAGKAECVLNLVPDWQNWKGENKYNPKWKPPKQSKLSDDSEHFDSGDEQEQEYYDLENEVNNTNIGSGDNFGLFE